MFILVTDGTPLGCLVLWVLFEVALLPHHRDVEYGLEMSDESTGIYYEYVGKVAMVWTCFKNGRGKITKRSYEMASTRKKKTR